MRTGLIAKKVGMSRVFESTGGHVPVTVLAIGDCQVVAQKTHDRDGYNALQLGLGKAKVKNVGKAMRGLVATLEPYDLLECFVTRQTADTAQGRPGDALEYTAASGGAAFVIGKEKAEVIEKEREEATEELAAELAEPEEKPKRRHREKEKPPKPGEIAEGLKINVVVRNAPPGVHGIHLHENGICAEQGKAAGGHFNPDNVSHGDIAKDGFEHAHAGDLGNIEIGPDGSGALEKVISGLTLEAGKFGVIGRSVILHEKADDFGQPTGNAGGRIACGVIPAS